MHPLEDLAWRVENVIEAGSARFEYSQPKPLVVGLRGDGPKIDLGEGLPESPSQFHSPMNSPAAKP
jgi:hypothetical protein